MGTGRCPIARLEAGRKAGCSGKDEPTQAHLGAGHFRDVPHGSTVADKDWSSGSLASEQWSIDSCSLFSSIPCAQSRPRWPREFDGSSPGVHVDRERRGHPLGKIA